jgi:hypothetical protein
VYVGESVGCPGGVGTFTATPPLGAPNGYRFGSVLPLGADVVGLGVGVLGAPYAAEAVTPPATASAATTAVPASTRDFLNILLPLLGFAQVRTMRRGCVGTVG